MDQCAAASFWYLVFFVASEIDFSNASHSSRINFSDAHPSITADALGHAWLNVATASSK